LEYRAELFDQLQSLFDEIGWNDHQLHCELHFPARLDAAVLERAVALSLRAEPILATRYARSGDEASWQSLGPEELGAAFAVTEDAAVFEAARVYRIDEARGPQLRICLLRGQRDSLAIAMNHMIADAAGFKDYLYLLGETYSGLLLDPRYAPRGPLGGDRGMGGATRSLRPAARIKAFLAQARDSNATGSDAFPLGGPGEEDEPLIVTRTIGRERSARLQAYCRERGATINDAVLAGYYRALARRMGSEAAGRLEVPIMVDMRRYLERKDPGPLRNLSSTVITRLRLAEGEGFEATLLGAKARMDELKLGGIGLGGFLKLELLRAAAGPRRAIRLLRRGFKPPLICMTNVGELDSRRLSFGGCRPDSAYLCGSIKRKPHFQLALSGYGGELTLSSNLYGSAADKVSVEAFLGEVEAELKV
jgi:NRPS condensation-like uncharacterized protein